MRQDVVIIDESSNSIPLTISNSRIFSSTINFTVSSDRTAANRICFYDSAITLSLLVSNNGNVVVPFEIIRPAAAWMRSYNLNWTSKEMQTYNETSMNNKGEISAILALLDNSYSQAIQTSRLFFAIAPIVVTNFKFQVMLPLRFMIDFFMGKKYLDMFSMILNINFMNLTDVFSFPPSQTGWDVQCTAAQFAYDTYVVDIPKSMPHFLYPNNSRIYSQVFGINPGDQTRSLSLQIPGKAEWIMYYFGDATNTYNSWGYSLPAYQQLQNMSGSAWPTQAAYDVLSSTDPYFDPQFGWNRFYREAIKVWGKIAPRENTIITADMWLSSYRIYAIECAQNDVSYGVMNLQIQMNTPALAAMNVTVFSLYTPQEQVFNAQITGARVH